MASALQRDDSAELRCLHCREPGLLREVAPRLRRCAACDFVFPLPRAMRAGPGVALSEVPPDVAPGGVLRERYRLVDLIGRGAHGLTFFAQHEFLKHPCVVKIWPHRMEASDRAVERLRNEAQAGYRVNDPHVVRVLDCDSVRGIWYFVLEYVDGIDLDQLIALGVVPGSQQALTLALHAASGLEAIHRAGLLHRDIKPGNLLLGTDGRLRVTDLGVVGLVQNPDRTGAAALPRAVGTLTYAAPEVLEPDAPVGVAADLYSLGATLFHLLTGRAPFAERGVFGALIDAQHGAPQWPADIRHVPPWFVDTVLRLMAREPEQRFASADVLVEYLSHPHARPPAAKPAVVAAPAVEPGGLSVLPFQNGSGTAADDWLGWALADTLSRELSRIPGTYVADTEQLLELLARQEALGEASPSEQLLAAGRLVGAATVITGRYVRQGDLIGLSAEVYQQNRGVPARIGPIDGTLAKLADLQAALFQNISEVLELQAERLLSAGSGVVAVELREKLTRGKQAYLQGDYEAAIRLAGEVIGQDGEITEALQYLSAAYARVGRYDEATELNRRTLELAQQRGEQQLLVEVRANMGVLHYLKGEYEHAQQHYAAAATLAEQSGLETERAQIYNNSGFALFRLGRAAEAEAAFRRAAEISRRFGALAALIGPYNGLGNVLLEQQRYDEARDYYRRALTLAQEIGDRTNTGVTHMHLGRCASLQSRFDDAKNEFALALNALEGTSFWNVRARTYEYIAEMNLRLGNHAETIRCADKRIELARKHANRTMEAAAWRQKAEALRRMGQEEGARACLAQAAAPPPADATPAQ